MSLKVRISFYIEIIHFILGSRDVTMATKRKMSQRLKRSHFTRGTQTETYGMGSGSSSPQMGIKEEHEYNISDSTEASPTTTFQSDMPQITIPQPDTPIHVTFMPENALGAQAAIMEEDETELLLLAEGGVQKETPPPLKVSLAETEFYEEQDALYERLVKAEEVRSISTVANKKNFSNQIISFTVHVFLFSTSRSCIATKK